MGMVTVTAIMMIVVALYYDDRGSSLPITNLPGGTLYAKRKPMSFLSNSAFLSTGGGGSTTGAALEEEAAPDGAARGGLQNKSVASSSTSGGQVSLVVVRVQQGKALFQRRQPRVNMPGFLLVGLQGVQEELREVGGGDPQNLASQHGADQTKCDLPLGDMQELHTPRTTQVDVHRSDRTRQADVLDDVHKWESEPIDHGQVASRGNKGGCRAGRLLAGGLVQPWPRPTTTNARANCPESHRGLRGPPTTQKPGPSSNSISSSAQRAASSRE